MAWSSVDEQVWDWMTDWQHDRATLSHVYNASLTHIGVACSCHIEFEYFCVIEFGSGIVNTLETNSDDEEGDTGVPVATRLAAMTPSFLPAGHPMCPTGSESSYCTEFEDNTQPSKFNHEDDDYYDIAWSLFTAINTLRWNVSDYDNKFIYTGYADDVIEH